MAIHQEDDNEDASAPRPPRYDGEDTTPTSEREVRGWYAVGLAAEIFAVCGVGSFAPVTLEQLAREAGTLRDSGASCVAPAATAATSAIASATRRLLERGLDVARQSEVEEQCVVRPFGQPISTPSFAMYTFSIAVLVQALALVSFSGVADYGTYRKRLLISFATAGSTATMLIVLVWPRAYLLASLLVVTGVVCLGSTFVLLNSFLPLLAANHPAATDMNGYTSMTQQTAPKRSTTSAELRLSTKISSTGVGIGYAAAVSVQVLSILLLVLLKKAHFKSESLPLRFVLLLVGLCWLLLTIPGALWLRNRPGPALTTVVYKRSKIATTLHYVAFAWKSVFSTIRTALKLRQTSIFLVAWFFLSDVIATVSGTAILFARTELHLSTIQLALLSITATLSGISGAFAWPRISRAFHLTPKATVITCVALMEFIPLYGLLSYLPFVKNLGVGGLQQPWEIYPLAFLHGFVMGGLSSYCRSLYGEIIPPGSEAAFYTLYAIFDKGSSAVGPWIVGVIIDRVRTIRPAFGFLAGLILVPLPLLYFVDVRRGREEAAALSKHAGYVGRGIRMEEYAHGDEGAEEDREGLLRGEGDD